MNRRMRSVIVLAILFLLALVFFNKSIVFWTTPKVNVASVTSGTITYKNRIAAVSVLSDGIKEVRTPSFLPEDLVITWVIDEKQQTVSQGDALIRVDNVLLDQHLLAAEKKYNELLISLSTFKRDYPQAKEAAIKAFEKAEANLKNAPNATGKQAEKLQAAYTLASDIYQEVVVLGIYETNTLDNLTGQCELAKAEFEKYQTIRNNNYVLVSPCDGVLVSRVLRDSTPLLLGNKLLFEVLPSSAPWLLEVELQGNVQMAMENQFVKLSDPTNPLDMVQLTVDTCENRGNKTFVSLLSDDLDVLQCLSHELEGFDFVYESPFYDALVPNNAFITENIVYAVQNVYVDNRMQYRIKEITVKKAPGNATHTPVINSLSSDMLLVTAWDRDIKDGDVVMIDNSITPF